MTYWRCRLDEPSIERFRRELDLPAVNNRVEFPGEWDLPESQVREIAKDAFMVLARQEQPKLDRPRIRGLLDELELVCEPAEEPRH